MLKKKLLIIGFVWPEPKSSAAGSRMMQLIALFKEANYSITFASACAKTENAFNLETINVAQASIELNKSSFDEFIKQLCPDVVLFDRFMTEEQFGWRVSENCPNTLKILDTEDLHFLRKGRHKAFKESTVFSDTYLYNDIAKREIASIYRCDLSLIISEKEMEILNSKFKIDNALLEYVPFLLNEVYGQKISKLKQFEDRRHFITIGNFLHEPNYNGVLYLKETIWPLIKQQMPKAEMHIYGAYASQKIQQLHNAKEGFFIKGFAEDVNNVMRKARVCLAPLRFGAGLKGKLVDAMINGTPCITTDIGAEGIYGDLPPNGFVENSPEEFAKKAIELYQNEILWTEKQKNGFSIINNRFNKGYYTQAVINKVESVVNSLEEHRHANFIGSMLQHHLLQSTKFMSKWIEEKNK